MDELSDRRSTQHYHQGNQRAKNYDDTSYSTLPMKEYEDHMDRSYKIDDDDECISFSKEIKEVLIPNNFICPIVEKYNGKEIIYHRRK